MKAVSAQRGHGPSITAARADPPDKAGFALRWPRGARCQPRASHTAAPLCAEPPSPVPSAAGMDAGHQLRAARPLCPAPACGCLPPARGEEGIFHGKGKTGSSSVRFTGFSQVEREVLRREMEAEPSWLTRLGSTFCLRARWPIWYLPLLRGSDVICGPVPNIPAWSGADGATLLSPAVGKAHGQPRAVVFGHLLQHLPFQSRGMETRRFSRLGPAPARHGEAKGTGDAGQVLPKPVPCGARAAWDGHAAGTAARAPPLTPAAAARLPRDCCRAESHCSFCDASRYKHCISPRDEEKERMDSSALNSLGAHGGRERQKRQQRALTRLGAENNSP